MVKRRSNPPAQGPRAVGTAEVYLEGGCSVMRLLWGQEKDGKGLPVPIVWPAMGESRSKVAQGLKSGLWAVWGGHPRVCTVS